MSTARRPLARRVRLYRALRTAHLERAHQLDPASIVFVERRYDFDDQVVDGLHVVQASPIGAAALVARQPIDVLEVNEPLMTSSLGMTALAVMAVRARDRLRRRRTTVVTYAIANSDPWPAAPGTALRTRVRHGIEHILARWLWRTIDRACFGTAAAEATYREHLRGPGPETTLVWALPAPLTKLEEPERGLVVFLGAFSPRKGVDRVIAAWPLLRERVPGARLLFVGKGRLEHEVQAAAAKDPRLEVVVDPPRDVIERILRRAQVLVLPSQPVPGWREQVGLPIVEGLSAGCSIVTTTETGLADWLAAHGHAVVEPGCAPSVLADAIADQIAAQRSPWEIVEPLPSRDGRLAADDWLFRQPAMAAVGSAHG